MEINKCKDCKHSTKETVQTVGGGEFLVVCCILAHWLLFWTLKGEGSCKRWEAKENATN
jgi:hypothetical protein